MRKGIAFTVAAAFVLGLGFTAFADNKKSAKAPVKVEAKKGFCSKAATKLAVSVRSNKCDKSAAKILVTGIPSLKCEKTAGTLVKAIRGAGCEKSAAALIVKAAQPAAKKAKETKPAS